MNARFYEVILIHFEDIVVSNRVVGTIVLLDNAVPESITRVRMVIQEWECS
jgi:hypothetical protein